MTRPREHQGEPRRTGFIPRLLTRTPEVGRPNRYRHAPDDVREAVAWLNERGFEGHFYGVPPEAFEGLDGVRLKPLHAFWDA